MANIKNRRHPLSIALIETELKAKGPAPLASKKHQF